jgi:hypothetical protein
VKKTLLTLFLAAAAATGAATTAAAVQLQSVTTPWVRGNQALGNMRLDPKGRFLAYTGTALQGSAGLNVLDLKTHDIYQVTRQPVGLSFFWAPDGFRLFYREMYKVPAAAAKGGDDTPKEEIRSVLSAYDCALRRNVELDHLPFATGFLTFDPRDLRLHLMSMAGVHTKRISFPDERLARWQVARRTEDGKFLATQNGIVWMTQGGSAMRRLDDDGSAVESFDIAPDGSTIAWATAKGRIYASKNGGVPRFLAYGRDPRWHPDQPQLIFAGARLVGNKAVSYDIKIADLKGSSRFLTSTQFVDERWPQWTPKADQVVYTIAKTTDVYLLEFKQ